MVSVYARIEVGDGATSADVPKRPGLGCVHLVDVPIAGGVVPSVVCYGQFRQRERTVFDDVVHVVAGGKLLQDGDGSLHRETVEYPVALIYADAAARGLHRTHDLGLRARGYR